MMVVVVEVMLVVAVVLGGKLKPSRNEGRKGGKKE